MAIPILLRRLPFFCTFELTIPKSIWLIGNDCYWLECLSRESFILNLYLKNIFTLKYFLYTFKPEEIIIGVKTSLVIVIENILARYLSLSEIFLGMGRMMLILIYLLITIQYELFEVPIPSQLLILNCSFFIQSFPNGFT